MEESNNRKLEEVADRMEITDLISRSAWFMDEGDVEAWVELFTDDAGIDGTLFVGREIKGKEVLKEFCTQLTETFGAMGVLQGRHMMTNISIELLGDGKAKARFYMLASIGIPYIAQPIPSVLGTYHSQLVKIDGKWLFSQLTAKPDNYSQYEFK
ncbi:MAG: nuclear transport factor 2 family protein [Deltaproteobacteria bacterium]|nr:nuclear transport factor 2 family protein [Deltaproteobacteria bacterium]